jgi:hypothetical protein
MAIGGNYLYQNEIDFWNTMNNPLTYRGWTFMNSDGTGNLASVSECMSIYKNGNVSIGGTLNISKNITLPLSTDVATGNMYYGNSSTAYMRQFVNPSMCYIDYYGSFNFRSTSSNGTSSVNTTLSIDSSGNLGVLGNITSPTITTINTNITTANTNITTANTNISTNTSSIASHTTAIYNMNVAINTNNTSIGTLNTQMTTANTNITANTSSIASHTTAIASLAPKANPTFTGTTTCNSLAVTGLVTNSVNSSVYTVSTTIDPIINQIYRVNPATAGVVITIPIPSLCPGMVLYFCNEHVYNVNTNYNYLIKANIGSTKLDFFPVTSGSFQSSASVQAGSMLTLVSTGSYWFYK